LEDVVLGWLVVVPVAGAVPDVEPDGGVVVVVVPVVVVPVVVVVDAEPVLVGVSWVVVPVVVVTEPDVVDLPPVPRPVDTETPVEPWDADLRVPVWETCEAPVFAARVVDLGVVVDVPVCVAAGVPDCVVPDCAVPYWVPVSASTMSPPDWPPEARVSPVVLVAPWLTSRLPTTAPSASTAPAATPLSARFVARERVAGR
jgi:hypothetical protein